MLSWPGLGFLYPTLDGSYVSVSLDLRMLLAKTEGEPVALPFPPFTLEEVGVDEVDAMVWIVFQTKTSLNTRSTTVENKTLLLAGVVLVPRPKRTL